MTIAELEIFFADFSPEMEVKVSEMTGLHREITGIDESSHLTDAENNTDENYLVVSI